MSPQDFALLKRIVFESASSLQDADPTADVANYWDELAAELTRAALIAQIEANRLFTE